MINEGRFSLGEECELTKYIPNNGTVVPQDVMVQGRKIPLYKPRQKLLQKHSAYMRLDTVNTMKREQLTTKLKGLRYLDLATMSTECLRKQLQSAQTSRSLCLWHDHATILKTGFIMITVHVMYDPIVFLTDEEYNQGHPGKNICVQAEVEQPEIYLLATRSSCVEDQAALVGDRLEYLPNLIMELRLQTP